MDNNSYDALYNSTLKALKEFEKDLVNNSYMTESNNYATILIYIKTKYSVFSTKYSIVLSTYDRLINQADKEVVKLLDIINKQNLRKITVKTVSKINTMEDTLYVLNRASLELRKVTASTLLFNDDLKQYVPSISAFSPSSLDIIRNKLLGKTTNIEISNLNKFKTYMRYLRKSFEIIKDIKSQYKNVLSTLEDRINTPSSVYDSEYKIQIDKVTQYFSKNIDIIIRISIDIINIIITILRNIVDDINKHRINEL